MALNTLYSLKVYQDNTFPPFATVKSAGPDYNLVTAAQTTTDIASDAASNGTWVADNGSLWFIKTKNCASGKIEAHRLPGPKFDLFDIHAVTGFNLEDATNSTFTIDGGRLLAIKTNHTVSGKVELTLSTTPPFTTFNTAGLATAFPAVANFPSIGLLGDGYWRVNDSDLFFIKIHNTNCGQIEVYHMKNSNGYSQFDLYETVFTTADALNGYWDIGEGNNLYFIKLINAESGTVEVHIASFGTGYKEFSLHAGTGFDASEGPDAFWLI